MFAAHTHLSISLTPVKQEAGGYLGFFFGDGVLGRWDFMCGGTRWLGFQRTSGSLPVLEDRTWGTERLILMAKGQRPGTWKRTHKDCMAKKHPSTSAGLKI